MSRARLTNNYRDGVWVVIVRTHSNICPVHMLEKYVKLAHFEGSPERYLFRGLIVSKSGSKLRPAEQLSYSRMREHVLEKLSMLGLDESKYELHSLCSGGALAAVNAGVPDT